MLDISTYLESVRYSISLRYIEYYRIWIHAVPLIRNAVKNGTVSDLWFCTVVSYFFESFGDSRFLNFVVLKKIFSKSDKSSFKNPYFYKKSST